MANDNNSPLLRRSFGRLLKNTHDVSLNVSFIGDVELPENDDAQEKRQRQQRRILEHQEKHLNSPSTPSGRRLTQGTAISGLTNEQLAEHYQDCMRLSTENKITKKNAFGLHLIDYMADMLKVKEKETNFQLASCTLDASAKIYSYRVDSVHTDAMNMATGLGSIATEKKKGKDDKGDDLEDEPQKDKKRKNRKAATIEANLKNITSTGLELQYEPDPLFQKMSSEFDECGVGGLLSYNLNVEDDNCTFMLDAAYKPPSYDCKRFEHETSETVNIEDFSDLFKTTLDMRPPICETFENFNFTNYKESEDSCISDAATAITEHVQNYAFNPDDCDQQDDNDDGDHHGGDFGLEDDGTNAEYEDIARPGCANRSFPRTPRIAQLETVMELASVLAEKPSDYSYFNPSLISAWGGPNHWRIQPQHRKKTGDGKNSKISVRKRAKKLQERINFDLVVEKPIRTTRKTRLAASTLQIWAADKISLPKDWHCPSDNFYKTFLKPDLIIRMSKKGNKALDVDGTDGGTYNYNNPQDEHNFCGNTEDDDSDNDCGNGDPPTTPIFDDPPCTATLEVTPSIFAGDNLVQQPYRVEKGSIQYEKMAKKIDVRKLKNAMWKILSGSEKYEDEEGVITTEMTFSGLLRQLPKYLSETAVKNVSVPIAFVCFLHIVNDKQLKLTGTDDLTDYKIEQG